MINLLRYHQTLLMFCPEIGLLYASHFRTVLQLLITDLNNVHVG